MLKRTGSWCTAPCFQDCIDENRLILTYLIPCHVLTTHTLPTKTLLAPYPRLEALFRPICRCIQRGDLSGFDAALAHGEHDFVKRRIYLTLERGRDIALRNLFRLVFLAGGYEEAKEGEQAIRRTRIPILEFETAIRLGSKNEKTTRIDTEEVECFAANLIYKVGLSCLPSRRFWHVCLNYQALIFQTSIHLPFANSSTFLEPDERLHLALARLYRPKQERSLPWNRRLKSKSLDRPSDII